MPARINVIKGEAEGTVFDITSPFSKIGSDLDGSIYLPSEKIPACAFILEYNRTSQEYNIVARCSGILKYGNTVLERGSKIQWSTDTTLSVGTEFELELETDDDDPEPSAVSSIVERRIQKIEEEQIQESQVGDKADTSGTKKSTRTSPSPLLLAELFVLFAVLVFVVFMSLVPPVKDSNTPEAAQAVQTLIENEVAKNHLPQNCRIWFQDARLAENGGLKTDAAKKYRQIRDEITDYWKRTGHNDWVEQILDEKQMTDIKITDDRKIYTFLIKKLRSMSIDNEEEITKI